MRMVWIVGCYQWGYLTGADIYGFMRLVGSIRSSTIETSILCARCGSGCRFRFAPLQFQPSWICPWSWPTPSSESSKCRHIWTSLPAPTRLPPASRDRDSAPSGTTSLHPPRRKAEGRHSSSEEWTRPHQITFPRCRRMWRCACFSYSLSEIVWVLFSWCRRCRLGIPSDRWKHCWPPDHEDSDTFCAI